MKGSALKSDTPDLEPGSLIDLQVTSFLVAIYKRGMRLVLVISVVL